MKNVTIEEFIRDWIPIKLKNKILLYILKSAFSTDKKYVDIFFKFGENKYKTNRIQYFENIFPFREEDY